MTSQGGASGPPESAGSPPGRWQLLFADLDGQFEAEQRRQDDADLADRTRFEAGRRTLGERLRASTQRPVRIGLPGRAPMGCTVSEVGPDWALVRDEGGEVLVACGMMLWVDGLVRQAEAGPSGPIWSQLDLRRVVRGLAQERVRVRVELRDGSAFDGTFDRVYADHADLACHPIDEAPRPGSVTSIFAVPFGSVVLVRQRS